MKKRREELSKSAEDEEILTKKRIFPEDELDMQNVNNFDQNENKNQENKRKKSDEIEIVFSTQ